MSVDSYQPSGPFAGFRSYADFQAYLHGLGLFRVRPGLERISRVLHSLGLQSPPYALVQVAGTNGKGSTCSMIASLALNHGITVGLHTSPHFVTVRERIRVNGELLSERSWLEAANEVLRLGGRSLSYFELITVMAAFLFRENQVQLAVMETGLGGAWDATTAFAADLVVFTPIGLDHQDVLGNDLPDIARDKAGAMRGGVPCLSAAQQPPVRVELERSAQDKHAALYFINDRFSSTGSDLPLGLDGNFQEKNATLALAAWRMLQATTDFSRPPLRSDPGEESPFRKNPAQQGCPEPGMPLSRKEAIGLARAWIPGRFQSVPVLSADRARELEIHPVSPLGWPSLLVDGAHNAHALAALGLALACRNLAPFATIFACLEDKNLPEMLPHLRAMSTGPIFVPPIPGNPRSMEPAVLAGRIGLNAVPVSSLFEALSKASDVIQERMPELFSLESSHNPILICGSLYLLAEFFKLRPDCLQPGSSRGSHG